MKVTIHLEDTSQAITLTDVKNTYTKGGFYCIYRISDKVDKYPIEIIWRVVEDYKG